jgi:hypothetical protein
MFVPIPIDRDFVPHTKKPVLRRNAGLFVDGKAGGNAGTSRVVPQIAECAGKRDGTPCGPFPGMVCIEGECVFP